MFSTSLPPWVLISDYVLNVTGWRWLHSYMTAHEGTDGNDLLDFTETSLLQTEYSWVSGPGVHVITTHDQRLFGYEGDDELRGNDGVDSLIGGTGNDLLKGGSGSDMYVYATGDGLDRITDDSGTGDAIYFSSELDSEDLVVTRIAGTNDLFIHFGATSAGIILTNQWLAGTIEQFYFVGQDGLTSGDIATRYLATLTTTGADTITGSWANETVTGLEGNDTLDGGAGNDRVEGGAGNDTLYGGVDQDVVLGGDGDDVLNGSSGNDVLIGGAGNDTLTGWLEDDTYVFNLGDGQDTVSDFWAYGSSGNDTILFGEGITAADLVVTELNSGTDMLLSIAGTTDSVLLNDSINDGRFRIEQVQFADGTVLNHAQLMDLATQPTSGNDTFYGSYDAEVLEGAPATTRCMGATAPTP